MKKVIMYTWTVCPFCVRAKNLLKNEGVPFEEVNLDSNPEEFEKLKKKTNFLTVPQIFIGEEFIGGFQELSALRQSGDLKTKLTGE